MALQEGYADIAYANTIHSSTEWLSANTDKKNYALSMGRYYIDTKYTCTEFYDPYPDELLTSNSILAEQYLLGTLYLTPVVDPAGHLTGKEVKAGSVSSKKTYSETRGANMGADRFPEVSLLLSPYCSYSKVSSNRLIRV